ncbi:MAG: biosynthetic peptidoglycan transglycosylase, partial [Rhodospirillaceae bacterium]
MSKSDKSASGWFWPLFKGAATLGVWSVIAGIAVAAWYATDLPDIDEALSATRWPTVTLLAADGAVLATRGDLYGVPLLVGDLPKALPQAVMATEDRRFYDHFGVDVIGIARAAYHNARAGRVVQGGSTITQQVAKNLFLTPERSLKRKVQEVLLSLWLEYRFSKDQILTIYLNRVYLGAGTYGVDAAARRYFGVPAKRVNVYEAAMIAGLLKAPSRYNPQANPELAAGRTAQVLKNMVAAGYLTEKQAAAAAKAR